jgi:hypothetical protein
MTKLRILAAIAGIFKRICLSLQHQDLSQSVMKDTNLSGSLLLYELNLL